MIEKILMASEDINVDDDIRLRFLSWLDFTMTRIKFNRSSLE